MSREQEIRQVRLDKKTRLQESGVDPYILEVKSYKTLQEVVHDFATYKKSGRIVSVVGRMMSTRGGGKMLFAHIFDGTHTMQTVFQIDKLGPKKMKDFQKNYDVGDFIQVKGVVGKTKSGEKSIFVTSFLMLTKSLLPLPEKWHGIQDVETSYRQRYLDALMDGSVRERFVLRNQVMREIRSFFDEKGFLEVETPILQNQAGGAMAEVFRTHHNDYDQDMSLRISLELELKMMTIAGYNRVYEMGKNFRNEGSDPTHHQEFTMLEWYAAYQSLSTNMKWMEQLIKRLAKIAGGTKYTVYDNEEQGTVISFTGKWPVVTFTQLLKKYAYLDITTASRKEIESKAREYGMSSAEMKTKGDANLLDFVYKKSARKHIVNPTFVMGYPSDLIPLAQKNSDGTARMYQLVIGGAEVVKSFTELVDPVVQRELLERQSQFKAGGDAEAMEIDERFLRAMEYGMPPMTGCGMGIDRLMAILTSQKSLKDVIFYPLMKEEQIQKKKKK